MGRIAALLLTVLAGAGLTAACSTAPGDSGERSGGPSGAAAASGEDTSFRVEEIASGLEHGWDIGFLPDGQLLVTQRPGKLALISGTALGATVSEVAADFSDVHVQGEGGLMGLVLYPDFAESGRFVTCQTYAENGQAVDVRLVTWELSADNRSARRVGNLLTGLPVNQNGRHSGCRPTLVPDGALLVGTGDTATDPGIPQDLTSLGGKVLRIDLRTGEALPDNPFADSPNPNTRRVLTYGHRNIQGVSVRPDSGQVFTAEHGPAFDDEVNVIRPGGNYGWDPSRGSTTDEYDESVPMTDTERFPDAVPAVWTSGPTTEAISGAAFLRGEQWGELAGDLAVVALKGQKVLLLGPDADGALTGVTTPEEFDDTFGRLRGARSGPDGALYVTTSNGDDDKLLRVTPAG